MKREEAELGLSAERGVIDFGRASEIDWVSNPIAVGELLPFRVSVVRNEAQLLRVQALRQAAYGRHMPHMAEAFGSADPMDLRSDVTLLIAQDKQSGSTVGTARIQSNRERPLQIEQSVELPLNVRGALLAEITRLAVRPGYAHPVKLALVKACHLFCIGMQIGGVLAGARSSLIRQYLNLGFSDLFGDERMLPLTHAGGLPHRILFRDTVTSEADSRARQHPDHHFVFRAYHPDIAVFEAPAMMLSLKEEGRVPSCRFVTPMNRPLMPEAMVRM